MPKPNAAFRGPSAAAAAPPSRWWGRAALTLLALGGAVALLSAKAVPCAFARLTHHPCPGCGSTRAVLALFRGDIEAVVRFNPLGPVVAALLAVLAVQAVGSMLLDGNLGRVAGGPSGRIVTRIAIVVAALETLIWIARFFGAFGGPVPV